MAADQNTVAAFLNGVRCGHNIERGTILADGVVAINAQWANYKATGIDIIRWFEGSPHQGAVGIPYPNNTDLNNILDCLGNAINAGIKLHIDCSDVSDLQKDFLNDNYAAWDNFIANLCGQINSRGWTNMQVCVGPWNELAGNNNTAINAAMNHGVASIRSHLPNHVIVVASANWGSLDTLADGTWVPPTDPGCMVMVHEYPCNNNSTSQSYWQGRVDKLRNFCNSKGMRGFYGEAGIGCANGTGGTNFSLDPAFATSCIKAGQDASPTVIFMPWAITTGLGERKNNDQFDPSLPSNYATAIKNAVGSSSPPPPPPPGSPPPPPPPPPPASVTVTINKPNPVCLGTQTVTGSCSDPTANVQLNWQTFGQPSNPTNPPNGGWVQATIDSSGNLTAQVTFDQPTQTSTLFYAINLGAPIGAWAAQPVQCTSPPPPPAPPPPPPAPPPPPTTPVVRDVVMPAEWFATTSPPPLVGVFRDFVSAIEFSAGVTPQIIPIPMEWGINTGIGQTIPMPLEFRAGVKSDIIVPLETAAPPPVTVTRDFLIPAEWQLNTKLFLDASIPMEFGAVAPPPPGTVFREFLFPTELLSNIASISPPHPVEWGMNTLILRDFTLPVEWTGFGPSPPPPPPPGPPPPPPPGPPGPPAVFPAGPPTRYLQWMQLVQSADPNWSVARLRPVQYDFSNGRIFVNRPDPYSPAAT